MNGEAASLSPATASCLDSLPTVVTWQLSFLLPPHSLLPFSEIHLRKRMVSNETGQARHHPLAPILAQGVESI